ncbi:MAG: hypothetical protein H6Q48_1126, partial [Deltaproteobacteria bacterium]|nr:hypothetical protein [Deltaproteobacteria bacterium]
MSVSIFKFILENNDLIHVNYFP